LAQARQFTKEKTQMTKYKDNNGNPYVGETITLLDGRILSGSSYTRNSKRLHIVVDAPSIPETKTVDRKKPRRSR
jgi:hypothetical protein